MRPSRSSSRAPLTRERRGSIIVWTGILAVVLVGFGAIAVDFGNFYVAANETQVMVDAAALAGAQRYQREADLDEPARLAAARLSAQFVASRNRIMGAAAQIADGNVKLVHYNNASGTVFAVDAANPANAVQVVDTTQAQYVFGHVLFNQYGHVAPRMQRGAVAWMANVSSARCIRPFGFSMSLLYRMLGVPPRDGPLTPAEVKAFNALEPEQRTYIAGPPQNGNGHVSPWVTPEYPNYAGLALTGPGGGKPEYQADLAGRCQDASNAIDLNDVYDQPSAMTSHFTTEVFAQGINSGPQENRRGPLCTFQGGVNSKNETCYNPTTGQIGIKFPTAFGPVPTEYGRSQFEVDMLADVKILCYVSGTPGVGSGGDPVNGASCQSGTSNPLFNDMSARIGGTIVGIIEPNLSFRAGEVQYSDVPSISTRLILVK
jgi:Flp pilus assembly protein TadG